MIDREHRAKWEADREEADRKFRAQMAADERQWRETQEDETHIWQENQSKSILKANLLIFGLLVTAVIVGSTIISAFIERGSLWGQGSREPIEITIQQEPQQPPIVNIESPTINVIIPTPLAPDTGDFQTPKVE